MPLQRYHLSKRNDEWRLEKAGSNRAVAKADAKENAILEMWGYMETHEGSVRIHKQNGRIQEERTYPRKKDPRWKGTHPTLGQLIQFLKLFDA